MGKLFWVEIPFEIPQKYAHACIERYVSYRDETMPDCSSNMLEY